MQTVAAESAEFFEKNIRPLLAEHCYECHGEKKQKGGLRLDSREGWRRGGDSGPAIEPGAADRSLLVKAVRYTDPDLQMPPKNRLSEKQVADLEKWINDGAEDPRAGSEQILAAKSAAVGKEHWAYQPVKRSNPPKVKNDEWAETEIDRFILAALETKNLKPVSDANRAALIRRAYFDLVGLPPTPEEVDRFEKDDRSEAFAVLVKQLLESPRFGERWARHWLDVARFGESVTLRGFVFKEAWRYRDYVIDAFNRDLPYDQFVKEQIAGDLLGGETIEERQRRLIATTFLMLGNTNLEEQDKKRLDMDFVDEQLDTIGKAFLAQTIGCARCHDHKFDPIPTADYYAMAGILPGTKPIEQANVSQWIEQPLPLAPDEEAKIKAHEEEVAALKAEIWKLKEQQSKSGAAAAARPITVAALPGIVIDDAKAKRVGDWVHSVHEKGYVGEGYVHDGNQGKGSKTLTFPAENLPAGKYDVRVSYTTGGNRAERVPVMILHAEGETTVYIDERKTPQIDGRFVSVGEFRFEANGQGFVMISNAETQGYVIADAVQFLPVELKQNVAAKVDDGAAEKIKTLEARLTKALDERPKRPMAMALKETGQGKDIAIHVRGSVHNLGAVVPRGFLQVAMRGKAPTLPTNESGRREMAEWLASFSNPLTARVMVNRVWTWLFGAGLVRTPDNFGVTGEKPAHPELLDYLAARFMEEAWSVKRLVFEIMTSRVYRLSATAPDAADPENRLLSRGHLRRLEVECLRDAILSVSGQLQEQMGGETIKAGTSADYGYQHASNRRSIYLPVLRNSLPELFEAFDFPDPSMVVGQRNVTAVPQQSLFLLNNPWAREQAQHAAKRVLAARNLDDNERIVRAYALALGRSPTTREKEIAMKHIHVATEGENTESEKLESWTQLWQALFGSIDFRYLN